RRSSPAAASETLLASRCACQGRVDQLRVEASVVIAATSTCSSTPASVVRTLSAEARLRHPGRQMGQESYLVASASYSNYRSFYDDLVRSARRSEQRLISAKPAKSHRRWPAERVTHLAWNCRSETFRNLNKGRL